MLDAKLIPASIQWHEGMLLAPQHFQQQTIRSEELLHYHMMLSTPYYWGIKDLKIDQVLLIDGKLRIIKIEALMPDGLVVYHAHQDNNYLEIDLAPYEEEMKRKPITVHLAVPALRTGAAAVKGVLPRYESIEGKPVVDENTGESEISLPRLKPKLNLLITDSPPQKYTTLPLIKIEYKNETIGAIDYVPPPLEVKVESAIGLLCAQVAQRLREKAVFLSDRITSPSSAVRGPMVLETKIMIHGMVSGLPHFEVLLNSSKAHPYALYLSLCQLTGNVATLGMGQVPPALGVYDQNDILACFIEAQNFIFKMIDEGILESHTGVPFDYENGVFSLMLEKPWVDDSLTIGVRKRPEFTEKDVLTWIDDCLIGSDEIVESMKEKRVLGAIRKRIESDGQLVPARGTVLLEIDAAPEFIKPNAVLEIFNTSDPANRRGPVEMVLYVRNKP